MKCLDTTKATIQGITVIVVKKLCHQKRKAPSITPQTMLMSQIKAIFSCMAALGKLTGFVSSAQKYLGKYWMTNEGTVRVHVHDISI